MWMLLSSSGCGRCKYLHARCIRHINVNTPGLGEGVVIGVALGAGISVVEARFRQYALRARK